MVLFLMGVEVFLEIELLLKFKFINSLYFYLKNFFSPLILDQYQEIDEEIEIDHEVEVILEAGNFVFILILRKKKEFFLILNF